jgi:RNA polymerase sigma factor (TIGR02999 family)
MISLSLTFRVPAGVGVNSSSGRVPWVAASLATFKKDRTLAFSKYEPGEITRLLDSTRRGEPDALDSLLEAIYPAMRAIAGNLMRAERENHTLEPTALAHEAIIRLFLSNGANFHDRGELAAAAGRQMRHLLIDHARRRLAQRRGGGAAAVEYSGFEAAPREDLESWLMLDRLLEQMKLMDPRAFEIVELRFFAGLSREEVAARLGINVRTVQRDWETARAWLLSAIRGT